MTSTQDIIDLDKPKEEKQFIQQICSGHNKTDV